jgi:hypothetical protein
MRDEISYNQFTRQKIERQKTQSKEKLNQVLQDNNWIRSIPATWPAKGWVIASYGWRVDPLTREKTWHYGIDIANHVGTFIVATAQGTITYADSNGAWGNVLVIDHGNSIQTRYAHLLNFRVKVGQKVKKGELIAEMGTTGQTTGPHLHYELIVDGIPIDPVKFFSENFLSISDKGIGPIVSTTQFSITEIKNILPGHKIRKAKRYSEGEPYTVIEVYKESDLILVINPILQGFDKQLIFSIRIMNNMADPGYPWKIGHTFFTVYKNDPAQDCIALGEEMSGYVSCAAPNSENIQLVFSGEWTGPDGVVPPYKDLRTFFMSEIIWKPKYETPHENH